MKPTIRTFLFLVCLAATPALAHSYKQGDIEIGHVWTRATAAGMTTAAIYFPLLNTGSAPDKLIGATSDLAGKIEIHQDLNENGISKMRKLDMLPLDPNIPVALSPGGTHLMAFGVKQQLKQGEKFPLTLQFEKAGTIKVDAVIEAPGAMGGGH